MSKQVPTQEEMHKQAASAYAEGQLAGFSAQLLAMPETGVKTDADVVDRIKRANRIMGDTHKRREVLKGIVLEKYPRKAAAAA